MCWWVWSSNAVERWCSKSGRDWTKAGGGCEKRRRRKQQRRGRAGYIDGERARDHTRGANRVRVGRNMKSKAMALHNCAENQKPGKQHFQTSPELGGSLRWGQLRPVACCPWPVRTPYATPTPEHQNTRAPAPPSASPGCSFVASSCILQRVVRRLYHNPRPFRLV